MTTLLPWRIAPLDDHGLPAEWQALNERCMAGHPLLDPRFVEPLLRSYQDGRVQLARLEDQAGVTGLALVQRLDALRWALFQPSQAPLGLIIIDSARAPADSALSGLLRSCPGFPLEFGLTFMDPAFSPLPSEGPRADRIQHATTIAVGLDGDFEGYWASRKKQLRYNLRNYQKRLTEAGLEPTYEVVTDPGAIAAAVDDYGDLESAGWKGAEGTAIHRSNAQGKLYREIMQGFAERGEALSFRMLIGGRLAAAWLIIIANGMAVMIKTTFDEKLAEYAVGRVNLYHALKHLFERGDLRVAEFYTNASTVWLQWANATRPIYHFNVYRHSSVGDAKRMLRTALATVRRRETPAAKAAAAE